MRVKRCVWGEGGARREGGGMEESEWQLSIGYWPNMEVIREYWSVIGYIRAPAGSFCLFLL